jgi:hypothetical protein
VEISLTRLLYSRKAPAAARGLCAEPFIMPARDAKGQFHRTLYLMKGFLTGNILAR